MMRATGSTSMATMVAFIKLSHPAALPELCRTQQPNGWKLLSSGT